MAGEQCKSTRPQVSRKTHTMSDKIQADISLRLKESNALLDAVLALQPRDANAPVGQRPDDVVLAVTQELVARIPTGLKHRQVEPLAPPSMCRKLRRAILKYDQPKATRTRHNCQVLIFGGSRCSVVRLHHWTNSILLSSYLPKDIVSNRSPTEVRVDLQRIFGNSVAQATSDGKMTSK